MNNEQGESVKNVLFQTGVFISLMQAVYEGKMDFATLLQKGNFGLGTPDLVNGEIIILDGQCYCIDAAGKAFLIDTSVKTPFSAVTHFAPKITLGLENISSLKMLEEFLLKHLNNKNIFYAIRIDATFESIFCRSEACQSKQSQPLYESLPKLQKTFTLNNTEGSAVVFYTPSYAGQINVAGFHLHYLNKERTAGGHVFDLSLIKGKAYIQPIYDLQVNLISTNQFANADLDQDILNSTKTVTESKK